MRNQCDKTGDVEIFHGGKRWCPECFAEYLNRTYPKGDYIAAQRAAFPSTAAVEEE